MEEVYGIWIGENMLFANSGRLSVAFLREGKNIISLTANDGRLMGVTYAEFVDDRCAFGVHAQE